MYNITYKDLENNTDFLNLKSRTPTTRALVSVRARKRKNEIIAHQCDELQAAIERLASNTSVVSACLSSMKLIPVLQEFLESKGYTVTYKEGDTWIRIPEESVF